ncbi:hypothetical protein EBR21_02140, partial [bacterium]|nr:hypothetical protein [bacterium]
MAIFLSKPRIFEPDGKESADVRKFLPPRSLGWIPGAFLLAWTPSAFSANFSRCEPVATDRDCIPGSGTATVLTDGKTINVSPATGTGDVVAFNWSVKNCKQKAGQLRSQLMLIVDNSKSQTTTDMQTARAPVVKNFIDAFATKAAASGVATGSADYPKIA